MSCVCLFRAIFRHKKNDATIVRKWRRLYVEGTKNWMKAILDSGKVYLALCIRYVLSALRTFPFLPPGAHTGCRLWACVLGSFYLSRCVYAYQWALLFPGSYMSFLHFSASAASWAGLVCCTDPAIVAALFYVVCGFYFNCLFHLCHWCVYLRFLCFRILRYQNPV